jgi:hypothetical protein
MSCVHVRAAVLSGPYFWHRYVRRDAGMVMVMQFPYIVACVRFLARITDGLIHFARCSGGMFSTGWSSVCAAAWVIDGLDAFAVRTRVDLFCKGAVGAIARVGGYDMGRRRAMQSGRRNPRVQVAAVRSPPVRRNRTECVGLLHMTPKVHWPSPGECHNAVS